VLRIQLLVFSATDSVRVLQVQPDVHCTDRSDCAYCVTVRVLCVLRLCRQVFQVDENYCLNRQRRSLLTRSLFKNESIDISFFSSLAGLQKQYIDVPCNPFNRVIRIENPECSS
jgi:hypothetical protein